MVEITLGNTPVGLSSDIAARTFYSLLNDMCLLGYRTPTLNVDSCYSTILDCTIAVQNRSSNLPKSANLETDLKFNEEIDPTPPNKKNNDYEEIKNQLMKPGRNIRPSNEIPGKSFRVPKQNVPESAKSMDDPSSEVSSPPPLSSQGRAKRESDDQILVEFEEEKEYEEMMEREDENDENNSESELLDGVNEKPEPSCIEPRSPGPCRASFPRYFFNKQSKNCEFFIYGGCRGNGNNFVTKEDCEDLCKSYEKDDKM
ncbi:kunitz-type precursor protease inhibitor 2, partial [Mytilus galloprovincialis]